MRKLLIPILTGLLVMALSTGAAWANPWSNSRGGQNSVSKGKMNSMQMYKNQYKSMMDGKTQLKSYNFKDINQNYWGYNPIQRMSAMGLFTGYSDGTFKPNNNITQAEMIAILIRLVDDDSDDEDVDEDELENVPNWARGSVKKAAQMNIMSLNRFHSAQQASRAQTCIAFGKALEKYGYLTVDHDYDPDDLPFADGKIMLDDEEVVYILAMYRAGYIKGASGNRFLPDNSITRAEMATILERILADLKEDLEDEEDDDDLDLADLEDELLDDYDAIEDVAVEDIKLDGDEDEVDVEVEVDLDEYEDEWADLSDNDIEDWLADLVGDIQDELDDDTEVDGEIIDVESDDVLVKFSKDGTESLSVTYKDDDYRDNGDGEDDVNDVEDALEGDEFVVGNIDFEITSINYYESDDEIAVELTAREPISYTYWNSLDSSDIEDDVEDACAEIAAAFQDDADADPATVFISLYDEDSEQLESYEYDVADGSLD